MQYPSLELNFLSRIEHLKKYFKGIKDFLIQDRFINLGVYSFLNQQNEYEVFTVNLGIIY